MQQGFLYIRSNLGVSSPTLELFQKISVAPPSLFEEESNPILDFSYEDFVPSVEVKNVQFSYPNKELLALDSINLDIKPGTVVALVGPSGAGKSTLVDIILGVLRPSNGSVLIGGSSPEDAKTRWKGVFGYVPQDIYINEGSVRENISMGFDRSEIDDERIVQAITFSALGGFIGKLEDGLDSLIGEGNARVSGGERQRIAIARAVLTSPKILVLDEATSALDGDTEDTIAKSISGMRGKTTLILIAHRLSTVRTADLVVYMEEGKIVATGDFDSIKANVPNFARQATLMGL